jgi:hypothetical protein
MMTLRTSGLAAGSAEHDSLLDAAFGCESFMLDLY